MNEPPELTDNPGLPQEIIRSALSGELVLFVGAGVSMLLGLPSWSGLAEKVLEELRGKGFLDYSEVEQLKTLDPRKRLSIADTIAKENDYSIEYKRHLSSKTAVGGNIYETLTNIGCPCVTTNYDELLSPEHKGQENNAGSVKPGGSVNRISERGEFFTNLLDKPATVVHLHGCVSRPETMIVTTKDYLEHYDHENVQEFLGDLFKRKVVLFLGYGLEEAEVLEHILRREEVLKTSERRRFSLQGFFRSQEPLYKKLYKYYEISFGVHLVGFERDKENYDALGPIIRSWASRLEIRKLPLVEHLKIVYEVLGSE